MITEALRSRKFAYSSLYKVAGDEYVYRTQVGQISIKE